MKSGSTVPRIGYQLLISCDPDAPFFPSVTDVPTFRSGEAPFINTPNATSASVQKSYPGQVGQGGFHVTRPMKPSLIVASGWYTLPPVEPFVAKLSFIRWADTMKYSTPVFGATTLN